MSLTADLTKFSKKYKGQMKTLVRRVNQRIGNDIVLNSPVEEGTLRANWLSKKNQADTSYNESTTDKSGSGSINALTIELSTLDIGDSFFFTNSLPYAEVVEYGGYSPNGPKVTEEGYSKKAPEGMVRVSIARFPDIAAEEMARIRGGKSW